MDQNIGQVVLMLGRKTAGNVVNLLGTCFAVSPRKFATAAHVIGPTDSGLVLIVPRTRSLSEYQDTTDSSVGSIEVKLCEYNPLRDISIIEVVNQSTRFIFSYTLGSTDQILTGSPVVSFGYPHADSGRYVLTQHASLVGARVLLGSSGHKVKHVVLNTQTRPGQSGGPVFSPDGKQVYAMVLGGYIPPNRGGFLMVGDIDPQVLHQTTHAVSAEYIKQLIR